MHSGSFRCYYIKLFLGYLTKHHFVVSQAVAILMYANICLLFILYHS